ncbi:hypothetical protein K8I61_01270 [bacterium]|nr:hypothetical protein [bacterium]
MFDRGVNVRLGLLLAVFAVNAFFFGHGYTEPGDGGISAKPEIVREIAKAAGIGAFDRAARIHFTWRNQKRGAERSYTWDLRTDAVAVTMDGTSIVVSANQPTDVADEKRRDAHAAFVNDMYWALFEIRIATDDGVRFEDLGEVDVPKFDALGKRRALRVSYVGTTGYTPGDVYVLYLGDDDLPVAWAFHKSGASEATFVTTRGERKTVEGISFPTSFKTPGGETVLEIRDIRVEMKS